MKYVYKNGAIINSPCTLAGEGWTVVKEEQAEKEKPASKKKEGK